MNYYVYFYSLTIVWKNNCYFEKVLHLSCSSVSIINQVPFTDFIHGMLRVKNRGHASNTVQYARASSRGLAHVNILANISIL